MASFPFMSLVFLCCITSGYGYTPFLYYMDAECDVGITFSRDVRMKLTLFSSSALLRNWRCSVNFRTTTLGDRVLVRYRSLNTDYSLTCRKNTLRIYDSDKITVLNGQSGDCGSTPIIDTFTTTGNSVTFKFQTDGSLQYGQFDILITSFSSGFNHSCPSGRYHCNNNRCISQSLVCNGYNDCADYSDENCGHLTVGVEAGIGVGVFVVIALCVVFSVVGARRRRYRRICEAQPYNTCHTTTTTTYPQQSYQGYGR